jgi:hypothetical protein
MPAAQTVTKEELFDRIGRLTPLELAHVAELVNSLEEHEPNEETEAVLRDIDARRNMVGPFNTFEEMLRDFGINVDL